MSGIAPTKEDPTTSQPSSLFDWDDVCLDPQQTALAEGRSQGQEAGQVAGFREGQVLGETKGIEFGMEIGFIRGFLVVLDPATVNERVQRSMHELENALNDFPSPNAMFEQSSTVDPSTLTSSNAEEDKNNAANDSEDPGKLDVLAKMQRIRARFKLLTVQLGIPNYSLKQIMDEVASTRQAALPAVDDFIVRCAIYNSKIQV